MRTIDRITTYVAAFGALLSALAFTFSLEVGIGALVGSAISVAEWLITRWLGQRILAAGDRARTMLSLLLIGKMGFVLGACALVLWSGHVNALGLMMGIGAMVLGVVVGGVHESLMAAPSTADAVDAAQPSESK